MIDSSDEENEENNQRNRRPRYFKERINSKVNSLSDFEFREKFRISKVTAEYILSKIGRNLEHPTKRNKALRPENQLLCALHWFGSGSQYHVVGDSQGVSKSTIYRCVAKISNLLIEHLLGEEVRWPPQNLASIQQHFSSYANFPRVAGIVDGSLIKIDAPTENELAYVDRNGDHSINAMFVCGPNLEFFYVNTRWPGSVHDSRVFRNSSLFQKWNDGWRPFPNAVILGDSGYSRKKWLITPVIPYTIEVESQTLRTFLRSHKKTRRLVENALGILKEKFPCLNYLRLAPAVASKVILACTILHNIEKRLGSSNYEDYVEISDENDNIDEIQYDEDSGEESVDEPYIRVIREIIQSFS